MSITALVRHKNNEFLSIDVKHKFFARTFSSRNYRIKFSCIFLLITLCSTGVLIFAQPARASEDEAAFSDEFNGQTLDSTKWVIQLNPGFSGNPAYGGNVRLDNGKIFLSSDGSTFPAVTSATNPFPETGDFVLVFNINYEQINSYGGGFWVSKGEHTTSNHCPFPHPISRTPDPSEVSGWANILQVWGGYECGIFAVFLGKWVFLFPPTPSMDARSLNFRLEYIQGQYSLYLDEKLIAQESSHLTPDQIGFGHEPATFLPSSGARKWSSISIDYVRVLNKSVLSLNTQAESTAIGYTLEVNGTLTDEDGAPLCGRTIFLHYTVPGLDEWNLMSSATTNTDGSYSATWLPTGTGNFIIRAYWTGDESYARSQVTRNVSVTKNDAETFFYTESNSTLSSLFFNASSNEVFFTVSGLSGTTGYVQFLISKTLIPDMNAIKVYLDQQQISCSISSLRDYWQVYFTYHHSEHEVVIKIPEMNIAPIESVPVLTPQSTHEEILDTISVAFAASIMIIGVGLLLYSKKRKN
jgi:hypothetical protein